MKGILFKVGIAILITMNLAIVLGAFDSYLRARRDEEAKAHKVVEDIAVMLDSGSNKELTEWFYDYCLEHADELEVQTLQDRQDPEKYEEWFSQRKEAFQFYMEREGTLTPETMESLDDKTRRYIAECWYNMYQGGLELASEQATTENGDIVEFYIFDYKEGGDAVGFMSTGYSRKGDKVLGEILPFTPDQHPVVAEILEKQEPVEKVEKIRYTTDGTIHLYAPYPLIINGKLRGIVAADWLWESSRKRLIESTLQTAGRISLYTLIADMALLILLGLRFIAPIKMLQGQMKNYMEAKDSSKVSEVLSGISKRSDEIGALSKDFTSLAGEMDRYVGEISDITREKTAIDTELGIATDIQAGALPSVFPAFPERNEFDLYASMTPSLAVGGDFYDFFLLDDDHLALVIADVSDKGVPSALFMMQAKTMIKSLARSMGSNIHPKELFGVINDSIMEQDDIYRMFVTVWMGIITISTGEMACSNAGHEYPTILRAGDKEGGGFAFHKVPHSPPIGAFRGIPFRSEDLVLKAGDVIFVYTDGVTEAHREGEELFGEDRLRTALDEVKDCSAEEIVKHIKKCVDDFCAGGEQFDDITMLCFEYKGPDPDVP